MAGHNRIGGSPMLSERPYGPRISAARLAANRCSRRPCLGVAIAVPLCAPFYTKGPGFRPKVTSAWESSRASHRHDIARITVSGLLSSLAEDVGRLAHIVSNGRHRGHRAG
jgi:hypothetical protein